MGGEDDLGLMMINWGLCCHPLLVTGLPPMADITIRRSGFLAWSGGCRAVSIYVLGVPWRRVYLVLSCSQVAAVWVRKSDGISGADSAGFCMHVLLGGLW